jgi:hypothetical protein
MPDRVGFAYGDAMPADEAIREIFDRADSFTIANEQGARTGDQAAAATRAALVGDRDFNGLRGC